jgi:undecaprenyl-diphosphatase
VIDWFQAIVYGVVQGLTEFLPVSSTAHVLILSKILGWQDPGAAFTAVMQIGTETAVLIYFRHDIWTIVTTIIRWFYQPAIRRTSDARLAWGVVWGSVPIGVFGLAFKHSIENQARNLYLVATMLVIFGVLLIVVERFQLAVSRKHNLSIKTGLIMGFAQSLALIPGVSRSGATITFGILAGLERRAATRFAFLLAVPAVMASGLLEAFSITESAVHWPQTIVATLTASVIGFGVIAGLLNYLQRKTYSAFGYYRVALGIILLMSLQAGLLAA